MRVSWCDELDHGKLRELFDAEATPFARSFRYVAFSTLGLRRDSTLVFDFPFSFQLQFDLADSIGNLVCVGKLQLFANLRRCQ